jgi:hypothetical protein
MSGSASTANSMPIKLSPIPPSVKVLIAWLLLFQFISFSHHSCARIVFLFCCFRSLIVFISHRVIESRSRNYIHSSDTWCIIHKTFVLSRTYHSYIEIQYIIQETMARLLALAALFASAFSAVRAETVQVGGSDITIETTSGSSSSSTDVGVIIIVTNSGGSSSNQYWNSPPMKSSGMVHQVRAIENYLLYPLPTCNNNLRNILFLGHRWWLCRAGVLTTDP